METKIMCMLKLSLDKIRANQVNVILPKIRFKRFMKLTDHTYTCNSLNMNQWPEMEIK